MISKTDIRKLITSHTPEFTIHHMYQEASEFSVAVSKLLLWEGGSPWEKMCLRNDLIEELADLQIMIEITKEFFNIKDDVFNIEVMNKMDENLKRCGGR